MSREETINDVLNYLHREIVINTDAIDKLTIVSAATKDTELVYHYSGIIRRLLEKVENIEKLRSQINEIF